MEHLNLLNGSLSKEVEKKHTRKTFFFLFQINIDQKTFV